MATIEIKPLADTIKSVLTQLSCADTQKKSILLSLWPSIIGTKYARNTKPRFSNEKTVIVWVDDSTLAFELSRRYKPTILKRLQNQFGEDEIQNIRFLVGELR
jgi:predicted nucleic acid-binding Zn ribbon protein